VKVLGIIGMHGLLIVLALIMRMKPRILLVEDDRVNTIVFHYYFQKEFEIVHLLSGYELFEELAKSPIDVVILDINLGKVDINVVKLVSVIREHPAYNEIIVFALTGYATFGDEAVTVLGRRASGGGKRQGHGGQERGGGAKHTKPLQSGGNGISG
jgi:CheY-like chemotaxis protein